MNRHYLVAGVIAAVVATAAVVVDRTLFSDDSPTVPPTPPIDATTTTAPSGDESSHLWHCVGLEDTDLSIYPDCYPDFYPDLDHDEALRLEVANALNGSRWGRSSWREEMLAICSDFDAAVALEELLEMPPFGSPQMLAYSWHQGIDFDDNDLIVEWTTAVVEDLSGPAGRAWVYAALTATGLYCPEHREHLQRHRVELLVLNDTVRRCRAANGQDCVRKQDIPAIPLRCALQTFQCSLINDWHEEERLARS